MSQQGKSHGSSIEQCDDENVTTDEKEAALSARFVADCQVILARGGKPTVPEVAPLVKAFYAMWGNGVGGSLHIVLDDGNVEDSSIEFCRKWAEDHGDLSGIALAMVLARMSKTQRSKLAYYRR